MGLEQFKGYLKPTEAASAIQAARLNAIDLLQTARLLHSHGRYPHSLAFSILALEEAGKVQIVMAMVMGLMETPAELWRDYRHHKAKTEFFNFAIEMRAGATFPQLSQNFLTRVRDAGPTPEDLDATKQLTLYSDCFVSPEGPAVHLPKNVDWKRQCEQLLVEAGILVGYLRDYQSAELEIWTKYAALARERGKSFAEVMKPLHTELVKKGFITAEQWTPIWKYMEDIGKAIKKNSDKKDA